MKIGLLLVSAVAAGMAGRLASTRPDAFAQGAPQKACAGPHYRDFDFWAGNWDVYEWARKDSLVAHARVELILEGCALREIYEGRSGLTGQSFSMYDGSRGVWHQSWVTNRGQLLMIEGGLKGPSMILRGTSRALDGSSSEISGEWRVAEGGVRETALTSTDGGKTWKPLFDLLFVPRKTP